MSEYETVRLEIEDGVALVTFDRPPVNATTREGNAELKDVFQSFDRRQDVSCVVFTGGGTKAFVAGADVKQRAAGVEKDYSDQRLALDDGRLTRDMFWSIYDCVVPVIGAINGAAVGAGLAMASVCDIIVASETARFGVTEINVGLLGAGSHLQRMVGPYMARYMYYTGELVPARDLEKFGSIWKVVPPDDLIPTAMELGRRIAAKSPIGLRLAKESLNRVEFMDLKEAYRTEQDYTKRLSFYEDAREASRAFAEKRPPEWKWK